MKTQGYSDFRVTAMTRLDHQLIIAFAAPESNTSLNLIGQNISNFGEAYIPILESSARQASPVLVENIKPFQESSSPNTFALLSPFHGEGISARDRGRAFVNGFVFATFDINTFFRTIINRRPQQLAVEIFDDDDTKGRPLFIADATPAFAKSGFEFVTKVSLANHSFTLGWRRTSLFASSRDLSAVILSSTTTLLTLLLAGMIANLQMVGVRAERIAADKTKELEKQRAASIHAAKMASLGEMAGGIAHEINNPLAIIQGMSLIMQSEFDKDVATQAPILEKLQIIDQMTMRMSKIIIGMRAVSRSGVGEPLLPESLDLLVGQTLDLCRERFKFGGITLIVSPPPNVTIDCRTTQIGQVLFNLLNNAYDAVENCGERWVRLDFENYPTKLAIVITDSGPPIPEAIRSKIFQPFYTTKGDKRGTGLGLSISQSLVETHHGRLYLDENSPHTSFVLELPKSQSHPQCS